MLAGVSAVWDAETKVKVEALEQAIAEVVPLDHPEMSQGSIPHGKFHPVGKQKSEQSVKKGQIPRLPVEASASAEATHVAPTVRSLRKAGVNW